MRVPDPIQVHARETPNDLAVIADRQMVTYRQLDQAICTVSDQLKNANIATGDCVGFITGPDVFRTIVTFWAVLRCGGVAFPMSHRLPGRVVRDYAKSANCTMISSTIEDSALVLDWGGKATPAHDVIYLDVDRRATILATSGSSGLPKLAVHKLESHLFSAWDSYRQIPLVRGDRWLLSIPLNHVGGLAILFRSFLSGSAVVVASSKNVSQTIEAYAVTHASLVLTQLKRLVDSTGTSRMQSLKSLLIGGSAVPSRLLQSAVDSGLPLQTTYGMTEASSQIATTPIFTREDATDKEAMLMRHLAVRVRDGIVQLKGPNMFEGYLQDGTVSDARDAEGWFSTGDFGEIDNRSLRISGRADNMFVSGGENIQPEEIEHCLAQLPGVDRAIVVPVPDAEFGWRPIAFVEGPAAGDPDSLSESLEQYLPGYKLPFRYHPLPDQYLAVSKIDRKALQNDAILLGGVDK